MPKVTDAHVEAPTTISVILAGVLLKMGAYGILRLNFSILPDATLWAREAMAVFGVINIVYAAFVCMAQRDLKKLIAYSSVSHMGFVLLGMAAFTDEGDLLTQGDLQTRHYQTERRPFRLAGLDHVA